MSAKELPGIEPWTDPATGITIRKSNHMTRDDLQAFYNSETGEPVGITYVGVPPPADVVGTFDTIILSPLMYEATKKSMMEAPGKDALRRDKVRGMRDLKGFDPHSPFRLAWDEWKAKKTN